MDVETMKRIIDVNGNGRLLDAVEIDVVGAAHFHRGHLRPEREQDE